MNNIICLDKTCTKLHCHENNHVSTEVMQFVVNGQRKCILDFDCCDLECKDFHELKISHKLALEYISKHKPKQINQHLLRVTILKNGRILYEYDLIQERLLDRRQAKNKNI